MKYPTIDSKNIWYDPTNEGGVLAAERLARDADYPFFIQDGGLYIMAYWRSEERSHCIKLECDQEDVQKLIDDIIMDQAELEARGSTE